MSSILLRLPVELHEKLREAAWEKRTSMNAVAVAVLGEYLRRPFQPPDAGVREPRVPKPPDRPGSVATEPPRSDTCTFDTPRGLRCPVCKKVH
jgi:hypothetical protein